MKVTTYDKGTVDQPIWSNLPDAEIRHVFLYKQDLSDLLRMVRHDPRDVERVLLDLIEKHKGP